MIIIFYMVCIATIVVSIVDISDFPDTIKKCISYILSKGKIIKTDYRLHLIDCSWCVASWINLIFLLYIGQFNIPYIAITFIIATLSPVIKEAIMLIKDLLLKLINYIYVKIIDRPI